MDGCWPLLGDAQKTDPASAQEHSRPSNQVSERQPSASFTGASHPDSNPQLETDQSGQPFTGAHCQRAQPPACSVVSAIQSCSGTTPSPSTATVAEPMEQLSLQQHSSQGSGIDWNQHQAWLIDDIITTGATVMAAMTTLERAGITVGGAACLGRTPMKCPQ